MNPNDPNVVILELVARNLGESLRDDVVFVGGSIAGSLITDPAQPAIRPTEDVDLIVEVLARNDYYHIEKKLLARGFAPDQSANAPICRWRIESIAVDVMPTDEEILGFSNRWYGEALHSAEKITLPSGIWIRRISAPMFLATKLEAFEGRGNQDYLFSYDLGDLLALIDGRDTLIDECSDCSSDVKAYLNTKLGHLIATPAFMQALPGHLPGDRASQERVPDLNRKLERLRDLANT
jgi:hypothetical protein